MTKLVVLMFEETATVTVAGVALLAAVAAGVFRDALSIAFLIGIGRA